MTSSFGEFEYTSDVDGMPGSSNPDIKPTGYKLPSVEQQGLPVAVSFAWDTLLVLLIICATVLVAVFKPFRKLFKK